MKHKTLLCAAFCGTGKSYLCEKFPDMCIEFECWEYQGKNFPDNYINDIVSKIGKVKYLFISTNPIVLKKLHDMGYMINLYYPKNNLKKEYFKRYIERGSHTEFLEALDKYWDGWLNELKEQNYYRHIILNTNEYLEEKLKFI